MTSKSTIFWSLLESEVREKMRERERRRKIKRFLKKMLITASEAIILE